jgi:hypothetical protein
VWKTAEAHAKLDTLIATFGSVGKIRWRPYRRMQIASASLALDFTVNIWDVRRPYVPSSIVDRHLDATTGIAWRGDDPNVMISISRVNSY